MPEVCNYNEISSSTSKSKQPPILILQLIEILPAPLPSLPPVFQLVTNYSPNWRFERHWGSDRFHEKEF
jgi:hypothetical protein